MKKQFIQFKDVIIDDGCEKINVSRVFVSYMEIEMFYKLMGCCFVNTSKYTIQITESDYNFISTLFDIIVCNSEGKHSSI